MSILASLTRAYERLPDAPRVGYSMEKIGFVISLNADGSVAHLADLRVAQGNRLTPRLMLVPQPAKRTMAIAPNFLWDKTSYALGVTAGEGRRTTEEHAKFLETHEEALSGVDDQGLTALLAFLRNWKPERFIELGWPNELKDQNVIFALESERRDDVYLHDRPAAKELLARMAGGVSRAPQICLVTGNSSRIARLHPSIKGVWGAQSSGAALISFNLDAFESYGHKQGDNAPVSEYAAFAYTTALNRFLERGSGHRIQIGDASTVFWADSSDAVAAAMAESYFREMLDPQTPEETQAITAEEEQTLDATSTQQIQDKLRRLARGEPLAEIEPALAQGVRFYVLGLAPNAARLSVRFYFEDDFGVLAENYRTWQQDVALEPQPPNARVPSIRRFELRTAPAMRDRNGAVKFDADAVSPLLAGELLRAILTGARFPASLLSLMLMRIRSDQYADHLRIALIKAVVVRAMRLRCDLPKRADGTVMEDYLMQPDPDDPNPARRLGRLFAVIESAQRAALGENINATVADKFLAAASATPGRVMPNLLLGARNHHIKRLRNGHADADWIKDADHARKVASGLDAKIGRLVALFDNGFPKQLSAEQQGLFLIGYYQERWSKSGAASEKSDSEEDSNATEQDQAP